MHLTGFRRSGNPKCPEVTKRECPETHTHARPGVYINTKGCTKKNVQECTWKSKSAKRTTLPPCNDMSGFLLFCLQAHINSQDSIRIICFLFYWQHTQQASYSEAILEKNANLFLHTRWYSSRLRRERGVGSDATFDRGLGLVIKSSLGREVPE